jgi:hypothetical protein
MKTIGGVLALAGCLLAGGCMGLSMNMRPRVLEEGDVRIGVAWGSTRNVAADFAYAEPSGETLEGEVLGTITELSLHYGFLSWFDLGVRVRPVKWGAKVEALFQVIPGREGEQPFGLVVGLGLDGFHRDRVELGCAEGGCFFREFEGLNLDVPVVASLRVWPSGLLFFGIRYSHLYIEGCQRYESETNAFPPLVVNKYISLPAFGWALGFQQEWGIVRFTPQLIGTTIEFPGTDRRHDMFFTFDLGFEF